MHYFYLGENDATYYVDYTGASTGRRRCKKLIPNPILPILVACFAGYSKGLFILKIDSKFYATQEHHRSMRTNKIRLRCRKYQKNCKFVAFVTMVRFTDPSLNPLFYDINNFYVESSWGIHTCEGYETVLDARVSKKEQKILQLRY